MALELGQRYAGHPLQIERGRFLALARHLQIIDLKTGGFSIFPAAAADTAISFGTCLHRGIIALSWRHAASAASKNSGCLSIGLKGRYSRTFTLLADNGRLLTTRMAGRTKLHPATRNLAMRCAVTAALLIAFMLPAIAGDTGPVLVIPGRPGVPVPINGFDASFAVVEGDWGLGKGNHIPVYVMGGHVYPPPPEVGHYYPSSGKIPGYGRLEITEPDHGRLPREGESYYHSWSAQSAPPVPQPPQTPPPVIVAPQFNAPPQGGQPPARGRSDLHRTETPH